jgi:aspartyl-tRNA synthetase
MTTTTASASAPTSASASIVSKTDPREEAPVLVDDAILHIGKRAMVQGWVHRTATLHNTPQHSPILRFILLRDGKSSKYLQIVLTGPLARSKDAIELHREARVRVWGTFKEDGREPRDGPVSKEDEDELICKWIEEYHSQNDENMEARLEGVEMRADTWEVIGPSAEDIV